ncbi:hypothetical protein PABG_11833 [Paracoccidioides brasiliensis Pb03]|uniref:DUF7924 domain-containing protein n=1 Tax=Paracoccidioides brasiliensis (strain Pb18) TaxID=502780 RepID=A0A0A0HU96_PARBD|nr:uncharacterized protein PADG_12270 [Paracoccidioides brasiliensis Pb18]KGM91591.1 hypothetical protein PADG_12270 [Paracoccidioides brasiliensis Pb18]KGY15251.1 hypothetical protein PABG_11833 [Paracoccidioides brasiliensis Pb03]
MATYYLYFLFLTCEVTCGAASLDIADRQNAHSATIAVRATVELFKLVKREREVDREILTFSISHDHTAVRICGHYAVLDVRTSSTPNNSQQSNVESVLIINDDDTANQVSWAILTPQRLHQPLLTMNELKQVRTTLSDGRTDARTCGRGTSVNTANINICIIAFIANPP